MKATKMVTIEKGMNNEIDLLISFYTDFRTSIEPDLRVNCSRRQDFERRSSQIYRSDPMLYEYHGKNK